MAAQLTFTPSATASFTADALAEVITLPPVDPDSPSCVIANSGPGTLFIVPGATTGPVSAAPGSITLPAGASRIASTFAGVTAATLQSLPPQRATVRFMRGQTAETWTFPAPDSEVF